MAESRSRLWNGTEDDGLQPPRSRARIAAARIPEGKERFLLNQSLRGIAFFGVSYVYWFLEICAGSAKLTQAVRMCGLTALTPIDLITGWDLTCRTTCRQVVQLIKEQRPLHTHLSPCCRIFSIAFRPLMAARYYADDPAYRDCMTLAVNVAWIVQQIYRLNLFASVENPIGSALFGLEVYRLIHMLAGFFYVHLNMCMYKLTHSVTHQPVWKGLTFLTNAPWLIAMGVRCDRSHEHTNLSGKHTGDTREYTWDLCVRFGEQLKLAPQFLRLNQEPVQQSSHLRRINSLTIDMHWPNWPLTFTLGRLEEARQSQVAVVIEESDAVSAPVASTMMAPVRGDQTDRQAENEEEFHWICSWLAKAKVPVTRIDHRNILAGTESYLVHFARPIMDWRTFTEKTSMTFTAYGENHNRIHGSEKARAMAYTAFIASRLENPENLRFGCGPIKFNRFHGNDCGEFWVYRNLKDFMIKKTLILKARLSPVVKLSAGIR